MYKVTISIIFIVSCILCCGTVSQINKKSPSQSEINNSDLYYDILNQVFKYFYEEQDYPFHDINGAYKIHLYHKAEVQKWNCYLYQINNFFYHHSYIDTISNPRLNTGIPKGRLRNICKAVHNSFELSNDKRKYDYNIHFTDETNSVYTKLISKRSPWYVSPVIDSNDGTYAICFATSDFEGGIGYYISLSYLDGKFKIENVSRDPQDHFGCWHKEDYVSKLCLD